MDPGEPDHQFDQHLDDVTVQNVTLSADGLTATVTTSVLAYGTAYTLTLTGITDISESRNALDIDGPISVTAWPPLTVTDVIATSGSAYEVDTFAIGVQLFIDRDYTAIEAPDAYLGLPMIRTAMDDKTLPLGATPCRSRSIAPFGYTSWHPRNRLAQASKASKPKTSTPWAGGQHHLPPIHSRLYRPWDDYPADPPPDQTSGSQHPCTCS